MFAFLTQLFGRTHRADRPRAGGGFRPRLEALDDRRLPTIDLVGGALTVEGTDNPDVVYLTIPAPGFIRVQHTEYVPGGGTNSEQRIYPIGAVTGDITVRTHGGDDYVDSGIDVTDPDLVLSAYGGGGNDTLLGGENGYGDHLYGDEYVGGPGDGNDTLRGRGGPDVLSGGGGTNTLDGGVGTDKVFDIGNTHFTLTNTFLFGTGSNFLTGIERATLFGGGGDNILNAAAFTGTVSLHGFGGNDTLYAPANFAYDLLDGGYGTDRVVAAGDVNFTLTDAQLVGRGADTLVGIEGAALTGGAGDNVIDASGFTGSVVLRGGSGDDVLRGGSGDDELYGQDGADDLYGNDGDDTLDGGADHHADDLWGGRGFDTFYVYRYPVIPSHPGSASPPS